MSNALADSIQQQLARYLAGEISRRELRDWFAPVLWSIDEAGDEESQELAYEVEMAFAEFSAGQWDEGELYERLRTLLLESRSHLP